MLEVDFQGYFYGYGIVWQEEGSGNNGLLNNCLGYGLVNWIFMESGILRKIEIIVAYSI